MSNTTKKQQKVIKNALIKDFKKQLKEQLGSPLGKFRSINIAKQYAIDNNIEPIIIISSDNSEMILLY